MEAVEDVGFGRAAVEIKEQQAQLRVELLQFFLHPLGNDVVGDAAKGLQTDHILDSRLCQVADFARQEPPFAEVARHIDHLFGQFRILKDAGERTVERERCANVVEKEKAAAKKQPAADSGKK